MGTRPSSRILVASLLFGTVAWVLDAWLSSIIFTDATFWELLAGDFPERSIYVRSVVVLIIVIFGLYTGTLVAKLEAYHEEMQRGVKQTHEDRELKLRQQNLDSIGSLAGGFAHEFNNILQAMIGSAYLAELQAGEGSGLQEHLRDIQISGARASKLCDQMLTYAGKKSVLLKDLYVDKQIQAIEGLIRDVSGDVPLVFHLGAADAVIGGDAVLFQGLLKNLVRNSVESRGDHAITVGLSTGFREVSQKDLKGFLPADLLKSGRYVELKVEDSGSGISANVVSRIFDPFYSTKFQGRGLGLSEVMGIVKTFGGGIRVDSQLNNGTSFTLLFPARVADEHAPKKISTLPAPTGQGLIWIVDDELLINQTLERVLTRWGFHVKTARSGGEFLERFPDDAAACSCVLLDLTMPGITGVEVHASLQNNYANIPVVIMSGYSEAQSLSQFGPDSIAGFLHKPFPLEALEKVLHEVLSTDCWSK